MHSKIWKSIIKQDQVGKRADKVLQEILHEYPENWDPPLESPFKISRSLTAKWIALGFVKMNGSILSKPSTPVDAGSTISINLPKNDIELATQSPELVTNFKPLSILYEDSSLLVINKDASISVHAGVATGPFTLVNQLRSLGIQLSDGTGLNRPGIVHRIDKNTTGALIIAKTNQAHQHLSKQFEIHSISRSYLAFTFGQPQKMELNKPFELLSRIGRNPADRKKMTLLKNDQKKGKLAKSHFILREIYGKKPAFASLVEAQLFTGRTHQIRVQLTSLGSSCLGDPVYGVSGAQSTKWRALPKDIQLKVSLLPGQALHARTLEFTHPLSEKRIAIEAPLPPLLQELQQDLQKHLCS